MAPSLFGSIPSSPVCNAIIDVDEEFEAAKQMDPSYPSTPSTCSTPSSSSHLVGMKRKLSNGMEKKDRKHVFSSLYTNLHPNKQSNCSHLPDFVESDESTTSDYSVNENKRRKSNLMRSTKKETTILNNPSDAYKRKKSNFNGSNMNSTTSTSTLTTTTQSKNNVTSSNTNASTFLTRRLRKSCSMPTCSPVDSPCMHCTCDGRCGQHENGKCGVRREGSGKNCKRAGCSKDENCIHSTRATCCHCRNLVSSQRRILKAKQQHALNTENGGKKGFEKNGQSKMEKALSNVRKSHNRPSIKRSSSISVSGTDRSKSFPISKSSSNPLNRSSSFSMYQTANGDELDTTFTIHDISNKKLRVLDENQDDLLCPSLALLSPDFFDEEEGVYGHQSSCSSVSSSSSTGSIVSSDEFLSPVRNSLVNFGSSNKRMIQMDRLHPRRRSLYGSMDDMGIPSLCEYTSWKDRKNQCNLIVIVEEIQFNLHQFPLLFLSKTWKKEVGMIKKKKTSCTIPVIEYIKFPGGIEMFEQMMIFMYEGTFEWTAYTIVPYFIISRLLELSIGHESLMAKTEHCLLELIHSGTLRDVVTILNQLEALKDWFVEIDPCSILKREFKIEHERSNLITKKIYDQLLNLSIHRVAKEYPYDLEGMTILQALPCEIFLRITQLILTKSACQMSTNVLAKLCGQAHLAQVFRHASCGEREKASTLIYMLQDMMKSDSKSAGTVQLVMKVASEVGLNEDFSTFLNASSERTNEIQFEDDLFNLFESNGNEEMDKSNVNSVKNNDGSINTTTESNKLIKPEPELIESINFQNSSLIPPSMNASSLFSTPLPATTVGNMENTGRILAKALTQALVVT